jgi:hypothetical protein
MIRRLLFLIVAVIAGYIWLRRLWARPAAPARRAGRPQGSADAGKVMVRDRVCNTFLPRSRAIRLTVGEAEHFFCSEPCRSKFLAAQRDAAGEPVSHSVENVPDATR